MVPKNHQALSSCTGLISKASSLPPQCSKSHD